MMTRKQKIVLMLNAARWALKQTQQPERGISTARSLIDEARKLMAAAPASTRRRWACGQ